MLILVTITQLIIVAVVMAVVPAVNQHIHPTDRTKTKVIKLKHSDMNSNKISLIWYSHGLYDFARLTLSSYFEFDNG